MNSFFLFAPFALQALAMFFDELYFHRKRGLGSWEKWGHPLDTMTVIACYVFLFFNSYSYDNALIYAGLSFFSCLFVTKDEFVHSELCEPLENWLHAILFILHPICFLSAGFIWAFESNLQFFITGQLIILILVTLYQIFYWSNPWKNT